MKHNQHPLRHIAILCLLLITVLAVKAQQPTWENGIACIIYSRCSPCHNPAGIAPFSLMSYEETIAYAYGIRDAVNSGEMPPYPPDRNYQSYQDERYLSEEEKLAINQWIKARVPSGNLEQAPEPPVFDNSPKMPDPDFSSVIPVYTIPNDLTSDLYRCFVISNPFPEKKYVTAIEVLPGNSGVVHHVTVFQDTSGIPVDLDAADPLPGYTNFGGIGSGTAQFMSAWLPGSPTVYQLPDNMALEIEPGSRIVIQVHYPAEAAGKIDSTRVSLKYTNNESRRIRVNPLLNAKSTLVNGPLVIAANKVKKFYSRYVIPDNQPMSVLGIAPHAHLICISMKAYAVVPAGDTIPLINIKNWDFHWQGGYFFKKMITLPAGTTLYGEAVYDNTANNPNNPNDPPKRVKRGEGTTDEMMEYYFIYTRSKPGDGNIVFDTTTRLPTYNNCTFVFKPETNPASAIVMNDNLQLNSTKQAAVIYPNPVQDLLQLQLNDAAPAQVQVYNQVSVKVYATTAKPGNNRLMLQQLPKGVYLIRISNANIHTTLRFLKE